MRPTTKDWATGGEAGGRAREVELERASAAIRTVLPGVVALVRSVARPEAMAVGEWRVLDVAAHLSHVSAGELFMAKVVGGPPGVELPVGDDLVADVARFNARTLESDDETDPSRLAARIQKNVSEFLDVMANARGDEQVGWLGGTVLPSSCLATHLLEELLIHGFDISRAEGRPWSMETGHAALGFGFFLDFLRFCPPSMRPFLVHEEKGARLEACFDFRMRGGRREFIVFDRGSVWVEAPSSRLVDCHISADPRIAMLAGFGRVSPTTAAISGRMLAWGRRPLLAFKLPALIRNP